MSYADEASFPVPLANMRTFFRRRPKKSWRYVGVYSPDLMLCVGDARIGPLRQRFWAAATPDGQILEQTSILGSCGLKIEGSRVSIDAPQLRARLSVREEPGVHTVSEHGDAWIWTCKQGGVRVEGLVELRGRPYQVDARGVIDDSAGYHARHTVWKWSAGVGTSADGRPIAWNLVTGVHDDPRASERSVWTDGEPAEVGPVRFEEDLSGIDFETGERLEFREWSAREDHTNAILLRTTYRQPFGEFSGTLPGGLELASGYGVMETHDVWW